MVEIIAEFDGVDLLPASLIEHRDADPTISGVCRVA
jgi:hypothetical protein